MGAHGGGMNAHSHGRLLSLLLRSGFLCFYFFIDSVQQVFNGNLGSESLRGGLGFIVVVVGEVGVGFVGGLRTCRCGTKGGRRSGDLPPTVNNRCRV